MSNEHLASARAGEFRRALVATANLGPYRRRRPPLKLVIGPVAAFALAGALTGGAVATAATPNPQIVAAQTAAAGTAHFLAKEQDGTLIGQPFTRIGSGTQTIDLGMRPAGATNLVEGFECLDPGDYIGYLNGKQYEEMPGCDPASNSGGVDTSSGNGDHILTIKAAANNRFVIWLSWVKIPSLAPSAAEQSELTTGSITRDDDIAAFSRYEGCMGALGHPIDVLPTTIVPAYSVDDSAVSDGADHRCYTTEYKGVDEAWQLAVEQTDVATPSIDSCLILHALTPAATASARIKQIQDLDLNLDECTWTQ